MKTTLLTALSLFAPLALLACSGGAGASDDTTTCEANPDRPAAADTGLGARALTKNGAKFNGIEINGIQHNGIRQNGITLNGVQFNGAKLNGVALNGIEINGARFNGTQINGIKQNGGAIAANELVGTLSDGRALAGSDLVGASLVGVLDNGEMITLTVDAFERVDAIAYYRLAFQGQSLCAEGGSGMFVPGSWDATGARHDTQTFGDAPVALSFSCKTGALAKCVMMGYAPWTVGSDVHQACTRMIRADYCGAGVSYTKDGTMIDVFDRLGVQSPSGGEGFAFEAAWGTKGAVCVSRPRYEGRTVQGETVLPSCWSSLPACDSLEQGAASGALVANASRTQSRLFCR